MDGDVITKFSHMDSLPNFLRYGALRTLCGRRLRYIAGGTDSSKKTHKLSALRHMLTKCCSQQIHLIFDCTFSLIS